MNESHDPNVTADTFAPANSPDAGLTGAFDRPADALGTTDHAPDLDANVFRAEVEKALATR
jgi:hypothetical protein